MTSIDVHYKEYSMHARTIQFRADLGFSEGSELKLLNPIVDLLTRGSGARLFLNYQNLDLEHIIYLIDFYKGLIKCIIDEAVGRVWQVQPLKVWVIIF